jgi:hypothetical protein
MPKFFITGAGHGFGFNELDDGSIADAHVVEAPGFTEAVESVVPGVKLLPVALEDWVMSDRACWVSSDPPPNEDGPGGKFCVLVVRLD